MGTRFAECDSRGAGFGARGTGALAAGALLALQAPVGGVESTARRSDTILETGFAGS